MTKFCPVCKLVGGKNYCWKCGEKLLELPRCGCGEEIHLGGTYCTKCGEYIVD